MKFRGEQGSVYLGGHFDSEEIQPPCCQDLREETFIFFFFFFCHEQEMQNANRSKK